MLQKSEQKSFGHLNSDLTKHLKKLDSSQTFECIPKSSDIRVSFKHKKSKAPQIKSQDIRQKQHIFLYFSQERSEGNKNFVKFLIKSFFKYHNKFSECFSYQFTEYLAEVRKKVYSKGSKYVTLKSLIDIVGGEENTMIQQMWSRRILRNILSSSVLKEEDIIHSHFIKKLADKKQQLLAIKIYRARLCHSALVTRIQTR